MEGHDIDWDECAHLLVSLNPDLNPEVIESFVQGYKDDSFFKQYYADEIPNPNSAIMPLHFLMDYYILLMLSGTPDFASPNLKSNLYWNGFMKLHMRQLMEVM